MPRTKLYIYLLKNQQKKLHPIPKISWLSVPAMLFMITIQAQQVDSLKNLLKHADKTPLLQTVLNEIASYYHNIAEEDSCQKYGFEALSIVKNYLRAMPYKKTRRMRLRVRS